MLIDWRRIVGVAVVLLLAGVLIFFTVKTLNTNPSGPVEIVTRAGDWVINGKGYNKRELTTVLFIGVGDGGAYGSEKEVRYLTVLAIDNAAGTYSLLHLDPDTQAEVDVINDNGSRVADPRITRIAEAQTYGKGAMTNCNNTISSVQRLLHNTKINHVVCVRTGAETPAFTTSPSEALDILAKEIAYNEQHRYEPETTEDGQKIEYNYTTLITDMTAENVNACCRVLANAVCEADESFKGTYEDGMFIPDKTHADSVVSRLYFKRNS